MTFSSAKFWSLIPAATFVMAGEFLMGVAGMVVAGHNLGESALASLNLLQPVVNIISFLSMMVGTGSCVLFSTAIGAFQERRAHEFFTQGLFSAFGLGLILMAVLALALAPLLDSFGASAEVTGAALSYGRWYLLCAVLEPVSVFMVNMCYSDGNARICFFAYIVEIICNFLLSVPLTIRFGLSGCAQACVIGNLMAIAVLCGHFLRKGNNLRFVRHFSLRDTIRICWCAVGDASLKLCYAALFFLLNAYVVRRFGTDMLAVLAVVVAVMGVAEVFDGVATAVQPLASVYVGERNDTRTRSVMNTALLVALGEGLLVTLALLVEPDLAVRFVGINDPSLLPAARTAVRLVSLGLVATSVMMLFNSYYMFIECERLSAALTSFTMFVAPVAVFPLLGAVAGANGVWLGLGLAPTLAVFAMAVFVCLKWGRRRFPYLLDPARREKIRVFDLPLDPVGICAVSAGVGAHLKECGCSEGVATKGALLVEETLMVVRDRNAGRNVLSEVTVDMSDGLTIVLRDDGEIFDLTDADARISSLRSYLVSNLMTAIPNRRNLTTTGFNRNVFKL